MSLTPLAGRVGADRASTTDDLLPPGWWARGFALHERLGGSPFRRPGGEAAAGQLRLERWERRHAAGLSRRLTELGIDRDGLAQLLVEGDQSLADRVSHPDWAACVERIVPAATAWRSTDPPPADWRAAFAVVLRPFVDDAVIAVTAYLGSAGIPAASIDAVAVVDGLGASLSRRLVELAARAVVSELHRYRAAGLLIGDDGHARFASFIQSLTTPEGLAALLNRYPVLARLLGQTTLLATEASIELIGRFVADRGALVAELLDGVDPGPLVEADGNQGDTHDNGRAAAVLRFADGRRVMYKPRDLQSQLRLDALLGWLNGAVPALGLRRLRTVARSGYGWSEYVLHAPLPDAAAAEVFYRRQGALLALLHALHATDIHCENLIACGDQPVVVDVETLLHHPSAAEIVGAGDPAADLLATSVHRTALLPLIVVGEEGILDLSGTGGDRGGIVPTSVVDWADPGTDRMRLHRRSLAYGGAHNRPRLGGADIDPGDYEPAMLDGFRLAYDAMVAHRSVVLALVEACAGMPTRLVVRPTWTYQVLLQETTQPELLGDALERDLALGVLWSADSPYLSQFARHEIVALWNGDVPMFTSRPGDPHIAGGHRPGEAAPVVAGAIPAIVAAARGDAPLRPTGLAVATGKITEFGEADRQDQEWIISATLATRRRHGGHRAARPLAEPVTGTAAQPERLVAAAGAVADQIVARGIPANGRVNWLGLELVDDRQWLVLPMGGGLANGYVGVAVFLAELARITGIQRYADVARRAVDAVPRLFEVVGDRPALVGAVGAGGLDGFGGVAYALARLATLLDDSDLLRWSATAVDLAAASRGVSPGGVDWAGGDAGCLAAMTAVRAQTGLAAAGSLAAACARRLVEHRPRPGVNESTGFASGAAGVGWALTRYAGTSTPAAGGGSTGVGDPAVPDPGAVDRAAAVDAGRAALRRAASWPAAGGRGHGWCSGTAGAALAQALLNAEFPDPDDVDDDKLAQLVRELADLPVSQDLSLCHGELGVAEALMVLAATAPDSGAPAAKRRRTGLILDAIQWHGPGCGTPGGVVTPGFLNGLAGIGYGLLRLAAPDRVPSVLLLQPAT